MIFNISTYQAWLLIGSAFFTVDIFWKRGYCLWAGLFSGGLAVLTLLFPAVSNTLQWCAFLSLISLSSLVWAVYLYGLPSSEDLLGTETKKTFSPESLKGYVFTLKDSIVDGQGTVRLEGISWIVEGRDTPMGYRVRVTAVDMNQKILRVERFSS